MLHSFLPHLQLPQVFERSQPLFDLPLGLDLSFNIFEEPLENLFNGDWCLDLEDAFDQPFDADGGFDLEVFDDLLDPLAEAWDMENDLWDLDEKFWDLGNNFWDKYWESGDSFWMDDWGFDLDLWEDRWNDVWDFGFDPWDEFHNLDFDLWEFTSDEFAHPQEDYKPINLGDTWFNLVWKDQLIDWSGRDGIVDYWINQDADAQYAEDSGLDNSDGFSMLVDYEIDYLRDVFDHLDGLIDLSFNEVDDWRDADINISFSPDLSELGFSSDTIGFASFEEAKQRIDLFIRDEDGWFDDEIPREASTLLHEIGHALGLAHPDHYGDGANPNSSTSKTIMSYNNDGFYGWTDSDIAALKYLWNSDAESAHDSESVGLDVSIHGDGSASLDHLDSDQWLLSKHEHDPLIGEDSDSLIRKVDLDLAGMIRGRTRRRDSVIGTDADNVIVAGKGSDRLIGHGGADAFLFHRREKLGKKTADLIVDFNPVEGDLIVFSRRALKGLDQPRFAVAASRKELKTYFRQEANIIYLQSSGRLFYDANGDRRGNGYGGLMARLTGKPQLSVDDFGFLSS